MNSEIENKENKIGMENKGMTAEEFMHRWIERTEKARASGDKEYNLRYVLDFEGTTIFATDYDIRIGHEGEQVNLYFHKHYVGKMLLKNVQVIL